MYYVQVAPQMASRKILTLTLILTTLTTLSAASPAEMSLFPETSSAKINSFTSYELQIQNTGPVEDTYRFSSSSPSEITIAPGKVTLEPQQTEEVNVWFNPNFDRRAGSYSFSIFGTSSASGERFQADGTVEIIKDHQVSISVGEKTRTVCRGQDATYNVRVTNNGIQPESFELETDYGTLSQKTVNLDAGEFKTVALSASSSEPTQKTFNVRAASPTSYASDFQSIRFNVETCYSSETAISPGNQSVAAFTPATYTVSVRNTGTRSDTFEIETNRGTLEENSLEVASGETESTRLVFTPESLGTKNFQVVADGQSTSSSSATLDVYNGMDMSAAFASSSNNFCEDERPTKEFRVTNTGEVVERYSLATNRGNLSSSSLELDVNESETVEVVMSRNDPGSYPLEITTQATTFEEPVKTTRANINVENCWDLDMQVLPEVVSAGENRSTVYKIRLNNTGTRQNTYQISAEGPEWVDVKQTNITIDAGSSDEAYIYTAIPYQKKGTVDITARAVGKDIERSETVTLVIGEDITKAVQDTENKVSGSFGQQVSSFVSDIDSNLGTKILSSVVVGGAIVLSALYLF